MEIPNCGLRMRAIRNVVYDSPLVARIILDNGEIELRASESRLDIYSKPYFPNGEIKHIVKNISGCNPQEALNNAGNSIINRVRHLNDLVQEVEQRNKLRLYQGVNEYIGQYLGRTTRIKQEVPSAIQINASIYGESIQLLAEAI
jgi:hypothetical protein